MAAPTSIGYHSIGEFNELEIVMSNTATLDAIASVAPLSNGVPHINSELTSQANDALVARARDVIAGRIPPPILIHRARIEAQYWKEFADREPQPTPEAIRYLTEYASLQAEHPGESVACYLAKDGTLPVLAVGEGEIDALFKGLTDEEHSRVLIIDNDP